MAADNELLADLLIASGFLFLISLPSFYEWGRKNFLLQKIRNTPTSTARAAAIGLVELFGKASGDAQKSPISGSRCAYWNVLVQTGGEKNPDHFEDMFTIGSTAPFKLLDGTGSIAVRPANASVDL